MEAGALPGLLPVGRPVTDPQARAEVARAWAVAALPDTPGRDTGEILAAAAAGELDALVIAGVDPGDLPDPGAALEAIEAVPFVVSMELRASAVTDRADVVFPVAAMSEKPGTFVNWEGRGGAFGRVLDVPDAQSDLQVLNVVADEMDVHLGLPDAAAAQARARGARPVERAAAARAESAREPSAGRQGRVRPSSRTWHQLLDAGRMQDGEPFLAGTARPVCARLSAATAREIGVADGDKITISDRAGRRHRARGGDRDAGPGGLAAGQFGRVRGAPRAWCRRRRPGDCRERRMNFLAVAPQARMASMMGARRVPGEPGENSEHGPAPRDPRIRPWRVSAMIRGG